MNYQLKFGVQRGDGGKQIAILVMKAPPARNRERVGDYYIYRPSIGREVRSRRSFSIEKFESVLKVNK